MGLFFRHTNVDLYHFLILSKELGMRYFLSKKIIKYLFYMYLLNLICIGSKISHWPKCQNG